MRSWSPLLVRQRYLAGFLGIGEYKSLEPKTNMAGNVEGAGRGSPEQRAWTASAEAIESPVFTTRSSS